MPLPRVTADSERRALRRVARQRALARGTDRARETAPFALVIYTAVQEAGIPAATGSLARQALGWTVACSLAALIAFVLILALMPADLRVKRLSETQLAPRPRWQYLLFSAAWLGLAAGLVVAGQHVNAGWTSRTASAASLWCGAFGLAMLGRTVCRGRARNLFWRYPPRWAAASPPAPADPAINR